MKSFRFVKPIFISAIFIDLAVARSRDSTTVPDPARVPVPTSGSRFEDKNPKSSIQHRDDRRILAAVHRPAYAFLSLAPYRFLILILLPPFLLLLLPFPSLPGCIHCASYRACMHARDPQFLRSYNSICIVRQSPLTPDGAYWHN